MNNDIKNLISSTKPVLLKLTIIIINFNVKYFLEQSLCSVINACKNIKAEIFVIDNCSKDGSREYFRGKFKEVNFIWNPENTGFSKANNQVLKLATGEFILFLNPDTILPEDCLEKCLTCFQNRDAIGAIGIRMIDGSGNFLKESKRGFPSPFTSLCKLSGLTTLFPGSKYFARYYLGHLDQHTTQEADVLSGAFMMIRKSVLDKTGGFDERLYNQDTGKKDVYDSSSEDEKIYDKPLFSERASTIYRPKKDTDDSAVVGRSKPVEFERGDEFGLGELAAKARARKN